MYYLYILQSTKRDWRYIGTTAGLENRVAEHNAGEVRSTKAYRPFALLHTEQFLDKNAARKRELHLKKNAKAREELFSQFGPIV